MNPTNEWGNYQSFMDYIEYLINAATAHPNWVWKSSR